MTNLNITDWFTSQPITASQRRTLTNKIIKTLNDESGPNTKFKFDLGQKVLNIFTYKVPTIVEVVGRYTENGWNKYTVREKDRIYGLREKDLKIII